MKYLTNDFALELPDSPVQDTTMNLLKFPELGLTLVVSRAPYEQSSFKESFDSQLRKMKASLKGYKIIEQKAVQLPGIGEGLEVINEFVQPPGKVYQVQLAYQIKNLKEMMVLTYVKTAPISEEDYLGYMKIRDSILME